MNPKTTLRWLILIKVAKFNMLYIRRNSGGSLSYSKVIIISIIIMIIISYTNTHNLENKVKKKNDNIQ